MSNPKIILASSSIGRKQLLEKLGVPFSIMASTIDEEKITDTNPFVMLQKRSRAKTENIVRQFAVSSSQLNKTNNSKISTANRPLPTANFLIIGADSGAVLGQKNYGKPKNKTHAKEILTDLMGKTHTFSTATTIILLEQYSHPELVSGSSKYKETGRWENLTKTHVTLRKLSSSELSHYTSRYDLTRFAAGYALNETPWDLVTKIDGSYTNVIGLPFEVLLPILSSLKII